LKVSGASATYLFLTTAVTELPSLSLDYMDMSISSLLDDGIVDLLYSAASLFIEPREVFGFASLSLGWPPFSLSANTLSAFLVLSGTVFI
jgi:hypothetical protein